MRKNPAVEILTLWQSSDGPGPQGVPIRGFGGQIYFFTQNKGAPVLVNGKVRIYVFDDHGTAQEQGRPIGEYDFDSANWNARSAAHPSVPDTRSLFPIRGTISIRRPARYGSASCRPPDRQFIPRRRLSS